MPIFYPREAEWGVNSRFRIDSGATAHTARHVPRLEMMMLTLIRMVLLSAMALATTAQATPRDEVLAGYATQARADDAAFAGFSAARGEALHRERHSGGKPDSPSCTNYVVE